MQVLAYAGHCTALLQMGASGCACAQVAVSAQAAATGCANARGCNLAVLMLRSCCRVRVLEGERTARRTGVMQVATINAIACVGLLNVGTQLALAGQTTGAQGLGFSLCHSVRFKASGA